MNKPLPPLRPFAKTPLQRFFNGLSSIFLGWSLLRANPHWWRYALWPVLIQLSLSLSCIFLINYFAADFFAGLFQNFRSEWLQTLFQFSLRVIVFVFSCFAAGVLWVGCSGIVCPYFYGKLAKKVELTLGTSPLEIKDLSLKEEMSEAVLVLFQLAVIEGVLYLVALFPIFGSGVAFVLGWYAAAWKLGSEVFDYPLAIRGMNRKKKQELRRQYKPEVLGIGTIVIAIAAVPVLGSVLLVPCVVGAVALHSRTRRHNPFI